MVGERFQRKINTRDVRQRSSTSAAARNLGEISRQDVDRVVQDGRDVRRFVRPYDDREDRALMLPARVVHRDSAHRRRVDKEDAHEVDRRMQNGKLRTDR